MNVEQFDDLLRFKFNGQAALARLCEKSRYRSLEQAVASLATFSHPKTIRLIQSKNVCCVIRTRESEKRGKFIDIDNKRRAMIDDNKSPTAFKWVTPLTFWYLGAWRKLSIVKICAERR